MVEGANETTTLLSPTSADADHYGDNLADMTTSRRLARYLSKQSWYNPRANANDGEGTAPSINAGWAYWEHITLPRRYLQSSQKAKPGDTSPTILYPVFGTAEKELGDFGVGVGLYFSRLRILTIITFIAGVFNIPIMTYYASKEYNNDDDGNVTEMFRISAICTDTYWVACPTCTADQWETFPATTNHMASTLDGSLNFIKKNACGVGYGQAKVLFASLVFLFVSILTMIWRSRKEEIALDESEQTTSDYSMEILNPPTDSHDPEEWKQFCSQFGDVSLVTVAVKNREILTNLLERRKLLYSLEIRLPADFQCKRHNLDDAVKVAWPLAWYEKLMMYDDPTSIRNKIDKIDKVLEDLAKKERDCEVSNVFVTFETEDAQRKALGALSVRKLDLIRNNTSIHPPEYLFRGQHLLKVRESAEPSAVRWKDLSVSRMRQSLELFLTTLMAMGCIAGGMYAITYSRFRYGAKVAALVISLLNSVTPTVCYYLVEYESHYREGPKEASKFLKITAFLWVNTAITTAATTPFTETLSNDEGSMIRSLLAIYAFEIFFEPLTQLLDPSGHFYRHISAPRAPDQRRMNILFQGTSYEISERYTAMVGLLFLTVYYSSIFPVGFLLASVSLFVRYWTDKFCLLRNWAEAPRIGTQVASLSNYFFLACLVIASVLTSYNFSAFPFDNACEDSTSVSSEYVGDFTAYDIDGEEISVSIESGNKNYFFCDQDMLQRLIFPAVPSNQSVGEGWMDEGQAQGSKLLGISSVFIVILVACRLFYRIILKRILAYFVISYETTGKTFDTTFSEVKSIFAYIPQMKIDGFPFPVLFCDISEIDPELVGWKDPLRPHSFHNAIADVPALEEKSASKHFFSVVKHWPQSKN